MKTVEPNKEKLYTWISLVIVFLLFSYYALKSNIPYYIDPVQHHLINKYSWSHPSLFLNTWNRPIYALVFSPFAQLGYYAERIAHVFLSLLCCFFLYHLACQLKIRRPYLSIIFLAFQVAFFDLAWENYTEQLLLFSIILLLIFIVKGKDLLATFMIALSALIRPEGIIFIIIWAILFGIRKKYLYSLLVFSGLLIWNFLGYLYSGDSLWLLHNIPYRVQIGFRKIEFDYILKFFDGFSGPLIFILFQLGLCSFYLSRDKLSKLRHKYIEFFITPVTLFFFFFAIRDNLALMPTGHFGWRFILPVAPIVAIFANLGFNFLFDREKSLATHPHRIFILAFLALQTLGMGIVTFLYFSKHNPYANMLFFLWVVMLITTAISVMVCYPKINQRLFLAIIFSLLILIPIVKIKPYQNNERDFLLKNIVSHFKKNFPNSKNVWCAVPGFYYLSGIDPFIQIDPPNEETIKYIPKHYFVLWDNWGAGRWYVVPKEIFLNNKNFALIKVFSSVNGNLQEFYLFKSVANLE